eukprot:scaffold124882_cov22-Tisochrysis_lutea.AAC.1
MGDFIVDEDPGEGGAGRSQARRRRRRALQGAMPGVSGAMMECWAGQPSAKAGVQGTARGNAGRELSHEGVREGPSGCKFTRLYIFHAKAGVHECWVAQPSTQAETWGTVGGDDAGHQLRAM